METDTTFFSRKNFGQKALVVWATILTFIAIYNFSHNLEDRDRYVKYEASIAEHEDFRKNDAYLMGAIKNCNEAQE
jgi:hypothetical protein